MADVYFDDSLWKCALKCAMRRNNDICSSQYDTAYCVNCSFFVKNYLPPEADDQAAKRLMHKADEKLWVLLLERRMTIGFAVCFFVFSLLALIMWDIDPLWIRSKAKTTGPLPVTRGLIADTGTEQHSNIDKTLSRVAEELWKGRDVNWDRKINCIDATVVFYHFFPDKSKVSIISNVNPDNFFNHLFVNVYTDGVWRGIEPQAYFSGNESYWMEDVWESRYDMSLDKEETNLWKWCLPWKIGNLDFTSISASTR